MVNLICNLFLRGPSRTPDIRIRENRSSGKTMFLVPRPQAQAQGQGPGPRPWAQALSPGPGPRPWARAKALGLGQGPWQSIQKICFRARFLIILLIFKCFVPWSRAEIENFLRSKALRFCLEASGIFLILYLPRKDTFENGFWPALFS